jgi:hypothetical protein
MRQHKKEDDFRLILRCTYYCERNEVTAQSVKDSRYPSQDSNRPPPYFKSGTLSLRKPPMCSNLDKPSLLDS